MTKTVTTITISYIYDSSRSGAHYSFDGGAHWSNNGDAVEVFQKSALGFAPTKDANTRYDLASDIEELNASVKSSRFTLTNMKLADTFEESLDRYFETVHSTLWLYGVVMENELTTYYMDATEFRTYLETWAGLNERGVIRAKATSTKMIQWLESRLG